MDTGLSFFGRKGLPQGRALPLLTSPCSAPFQVPGLPGGWIKGKETRSHEENRCPGEVGGGSQLSNSYSPNVSSLLLGLVPGAECWHLHPQLCFHFTEARMGAQEHRQLRHQDVELVRGDSGPSPERLLPSPDLAARSGLRMESGWLPGSQGLGGGCRSHVP